MKNTLRRNTILSATFGLALLPLTGEAHPGHDGDHSHSLAALIMLMAAVFVVKHTLELANKLTKRVRNR